MRQNRGFALAGLIGNMLGGPNRTHERSRTLPGIGKAFADQWGIAE